MTFQETDERRGYLNAFVCFSAGLVCGWVVKGASKRVFPIRRLWNIKDSFGAGTSMCRPKMVMVVRSDLGMTSGKVASQCSHAAVACYELVRGSDIAEHWKAQGQPKVVLKQDKGEFGLLELLKHAKSLGVPATVVRDAGRTQISAGSAAVLGIGPADSEKVDSIVGHLKLY
ncbi:peptidyl-tRNA hydrolase 2, mitochondrial-like [Ischnura elegans]|uniref:peptidyl-tRNA hydrolase 2, mitochondrial-like n=1 Tax=Ischnura elegans TaxID=197161 RepID=UPI001ED8817A|nr:peptidyl-tRNA hydrolase 2, mitochondrial-like [Ischnura elegans]